MDRAMNPEVADPRRSTTQLRHEALLYSGVRELVRTVARFARRGLADGARVVVALPGHKFAPLRAELGADAADVTLLDMHEVGQNPGRLTSIWHRQAREANSAGVALWGVGEPVWAERSEAEVIEAQLHESLLNAALRDTSTWLLCPYDVGTLGGPIVAAARHSHGAVQHAQIGLREGTAVDGTVGGAGVFDAPLAPADGDVGAASIEGPALRPIRAIVDREGRAAGLEESRLHDLVLAVSELATNTLRHSGGPGLLRWWTKPSAPRAFVCEVVDRGRLRDPLVGRMHPAPSQTGGRGLWLVHHLCDLVQVRSSEVGTTVRVTMRLLDHPSSSDG